MNKEGELLDTNHQWNIANNTYNGLGAFLVIPGVFVGLHKVMPLLSMIASILVFMMTPGTLSFLVTTPES